MAGQDATWSAYRERIAEMEALKGAMGVLSWDQQTFMPPGGAGHRGAQLAALASVFHERMTAPGLGDILEELLASPDPERAAAARRVKRRVEPAGQPHRSQARIRSLMHLAPSRMVLASMKAESHLPQAYNRRDDADRGVGRFKARSLLDVPFEVAKPPCRPQVVPVHDRLIHEPRCRAIGPHLLQRRREIPDENARAG